jgi:hypothetical protein
MSTIITPKEVVEFAFAPSESFSAEVITDSDVAIAETRYLLPILGYELYNMVRSGEYDTLRVEYILPMVASWTRYVVEPLLTRRCAVCGYKPYEYDGVVLRRLRSTAATFSRNLTNYLNSHQEEFPEYDPSDNPLNRCSIDGNIVQVY